MSRSEGAWENCTEQATPSRPKRAAPLREQRYRADLSTVSGATTPETVDKGRDSTGRDDRAARAPGRAVLRAPGSLSPRKLTLKDATCGRVLRTALRAALDREL